MGLPDYHSGATCKTTSLAHLARRTTGHVAGGFDSFRRLDLRLNDCSRERGLSATIVSDNPSKLKDARELADVVTGVVAVLFGIWMKGG